MNDTLISLVVCLALAAFVLATCRPRSQRATARRPLRQNRDETVTVVVNNRPVRMPAVRRIPLLFGSETGFEEEKTQPARKSAVDQDMKTKIQVSNPRASKCVDNGLDLDIKVERLGNGEVTLVRDHEGSWATWGAPDNWLSDSILASIRTHCDCDTLLREIAGAVCAYANS